MSESVLEVIVQDSQDTVITVDNPGATTVIEVQVPGPPGPPGTGSTADLPSGGTAGQVLTKTGPTDADIDWLTADVTQTELDAKFSKKNNGNIALDPEDDVVADFRVNKVDGGSESGWIEKLSFWFSENGTTWVRGWFTDKFGQLRARAIRDNESAFIAYPKSNSSTTDILKVTNADGSTTFLGASKTAVTATVPVIAPNLVPSILLENGDPVPGGTAPGTLVFEKNV